jgi:hypothetical protein
VWQCPTCTKEAQARFKKKRPNYWAEKAREKYQHVGQPTTRRPGIEAVLDPTTKEFFRDNGYRLVECKSCEEIKLVDQLTLTCNRCSGRGCNERKAAN